jgi:hypothetical protein
LVETSLVGEFPAEPAQYRRLEDRVVFPIEVEIPPHLFSFSGGWLRLPWDPDLARENPHVHAGSPPPFHDVHA